ncbi:hypothetical protein [Methanobrevibacter sp.]|uniref:hypothetical protein n=1 Tax=Methanobrevibacter sp. TaxID=66852 RepID=UPI0026E0C9B4|nr:hypothetical protein [Methanobrevibacter sp.]MDO5859160.1 hypothetical protein [Methanobrevibacter sp.]
MVRDIHDIYDVILKIIISVYGKHFLNYIGIDEDIKEVLNVELTTLNGNKLYLDFLCLLKNDTISHIEFQYPKSQPKHLDRFFNYNIVAQAKYQKTVDTTIFNFTHKLDDEKPQRMGQTKCFIPSRFYLGDVNFEEYIRNINIKLESNTQLSHSEEITLLLMSLNPKFDNKYNILHDISKIIEKKELFDKNRFEFFKSVVELEIENFLTKDEQNKISEGVKMTPKAMDVVTRAINEVNQKVLAETREDALAEGRAEGKAEGIDEATGSIAKALRNTVDLKDLSIATGLTIDEIKRL